MENMTRQDDKVVIDVYRKDRDRLKDLAADLTAEGNGRYYQADALRWLLNFREQSVELIMGGEVSS
jgi:hypothetical protein